MTRPDVSRRAAKGPLTGGRAQRVEDLQDPKWLERIRDAEGVPDRHRRRAEAEIARRNGGVPRR